MVQEARYWEVVLSRGDGALVTEEEEEGSMPLGRLPKGALVKELEPPFGSRHALGRRLRFSKALGAGPEAGWVTTSLREKDFLVRTYDVRPEQLAPLGAASSPAAASEAAAKPGAASPPPAPSLSGRRPYDLVIYGATGFTGSLAAEHLDALLAARGPAGGGSSTALRWALAGRSAVRLEEVGRRCKSTPDVLQVQTEQDVSRLAASCRVLLALAGPYQESGEAAVKACVEHGTHYVDVTGEIAWVRQIIDKYHGAARARGVMLVHFAGQVCTIDEVNCYLLAKKLGPLRQFREYFAQYGATTGGSLATNIATMRGMTKETLEVVNDPFCLGGRRRRGIGEEDKDCTAAAKDPLYPSIWLQPAYNSSCGSRALRRSCELFEQSPGDGLLYGEELRVTIRDGALNQRAAEMAVQMTGPVQSCEVASGAARQLQAQVSRGEAPKPGQGPPAETRARFYSDVYAVAEGENGKWAHVHYTGPEAYETTAICCVTTALCLAEETERLCPGSRGGVLTPAFAMHGSSFVERLQAWPFALGSVSGGGDRPMKFELCEGRPEEAVLKKLVSDRMKSAMMGQAEISEGRLKAFT